MKHLSWDELFELIDEQAEPIRRRELEQHVSECSRCRRLVESQRSFERTLRKLPLAKPSRELTAKILASLGSVRKEGLVWKLFTILGAGIPLALVLGLIVYVLLGVSAQPKAEEDAFAGAFGSLEGTLDQIQSAIGSVLGATGTSISHFAQSDIIGIAALAVVSVTLLVVADRVFLRRILRSHM